MNSGELGEYIQEVIETNPAVDIDHSGYQEKKNLIIYYNPSYQDSRVYQSLDDNSSIWETIGRTDKSLASDLRAQLNSSLFQTEDIKQLSRIISLLDENGFIDEDDLLICSKLELSQNQYSFYLDKLQGLEPAGVGSRTIKEFLLLKLRREENRNPLAEKIVAESLDELTDGKYTQLAKKYKVKKQEIIEIRQLLKNISIMPGDEYKEAKEQVSIIPDIEIIETENGLCIQILGISCSANDYYKEYLASDADIETKKYIRKCFRDLHNIQYGLEQRNSTISSIARYIVEEQMAFFEKGEASLKAMRQKEISQRLNLNESTISRAIKDKYLKCKWGTFPLKYFFSVNMRGEYSGKVNPLAELKKLILEEDKTSPLSDQKLTDELIKRGFNISRRTVTKYRENAGIKSAAQRKN